MAFSVGKPAIGRTAGRAGATGSIGAVGAIASYTTADEASQAIRNESAKWTRVIKEGNVKPQCKVSTYLNLVRLAGIEPTTLGFGGQYSIH